jgi:hypothetical protein
MSAVVTVWPGATKIAKQLSQQGLVKPNVCVNCSLLAHKTGPILRFSVWDHYNNAQYSDTKVCIELCQIYKYSILYTNIHKNILLTNILKIYYIQIHYTILYLKSSGPYCYRASPSTIEEPSFAPTRTDQTIIPSTTNCLPSC